MTLSSSRTLLLPLSSTTSSSAHPGLLSSSALLLPRSNTPWCGKVALAHSMSGRLAKCEMRGFLVQLLGSRCSHARCMASALGKSE